MCDVNGWSFVKNSWKYYDDAAGILRSLILGSLAPHRTRTSLPALKMFPVQRATEMMVDVNEEERSQLPDLKEFEDEMTHNRGVRAFVGK